VATDGARLAIRLLQDAAERGELDPWDVDVIAVVDGFLDQLRQRIEVPRIVAAMGRGGSYEQDLAETSEAFLAASMLVSLKAEVLEAQTFPPEPLLDDDVSFDFDAEGQGWLLSHGVELPRRPERHLLRRPVTLGELIRQLEDIAERLEQEEGQRSRRQRPKRYSDRAVIEQVAALAHREKLPETTAALSQFLLQWPQSLEWTGFEGLVEAWRAVAPPDLDTDRVGVFWALLFLCSQGKVELDQQGGLFGPLQLKRLLDERESVQLPLPSELGSARGPAREPLAA
jgi:segregation and condensation protein A